MVLCLEINLEKILSNATNSSQRKSCEKKLLKDHRNDESNFNKVTNI